MLSALDGVGPEDLNVAGLVNRVQEGQVREVILAMNPTLEGDVTVMTIERRVHKESPAVRTTRLARGLSIGSDLEYADEVTLTRALEGRQQV